ncbi:ParB/RepB/Spo0J family partition protein [Deinococcus sp. RM]|uniref:ParB/RepB/Spo0J family partition protein n=1 Tax=Deinococcus sp. RM TaxID=2316359 RepID=UPI000E68E290|nr:ParB/RepB/Spo0J family partition protein [Deinococcus sp. RM]RIY05233.1 ParB/RepB/Spo0J family partition protein [Deinococcus sp. RM]
MARAKRPTLSDSLAELVGEASTVAAPAAAGERVTDVARDLIDPNPYQPRRHFDPQALEQLAVSIHTHGVLQPLLVRPVPGGRYQIVGGERRWRAIGLLTDPQRPLTVDGQPLPARAELERVPVVIRDVADTDMRVLAAVENLQRTDLNIIDEVDATVALIAATLGLSEDDVPATLARLVRAPGEQGAKLDALFAQLGRGTWSSFFKNKLRVRRLPEDVLSAMRQDGLDYRKATLIGAQPDAERRAALLDLARGGASVEHLSQAAKLGAPGGDASPQAPDLSRLVGRRLTSASAVSALSAARRKRLERLLAQVNDLFEEQEKDTPDRRPKGR